MDKLNETKDSMELMMGAMMWMMIGGAGSNSPGNRGAK
jgi:hypothetical protein